MVNKLFLLEKETTFFEFQFVENEIKLKELHKLVTVWREQYSRADRSKCLWTDYPLFSEKQSTKYTEQFPTTLPFKWTTNALLYKITASKILTGKLSTCPAVEAVTGIGSLLLHERDHFE